MFKMFRFAEVHAEIERSSEREGNAVPFCISFISNGYQYHISLSADLHCVARHLQALQSNILFQ